MLPECCVGATRIKGSSCFPHCDPHCCQHTFYRGCGTSVSIRIVGPMDVGTTVAYARFQSATAEPFAVHDIVATAMFESDLRSRTNLTGTWLAGHREMLDGHVCFTFNDKRSEGWHYDWHGGSSTKKRTELHHLVVYLFQARGANQLVVLGRVASPPFTLSSYRRAKAVKKDKQAPLVRVASRATPSDSHVELVVLAQSSTQETATRLLQLYEFCRSITMDLVEWEAAEASLVCALHERYTGRTRRRPSPLLPARGTPCAEPPPVSLITVGLHVISWWFMPSTLAWVHAFCRRHHGAVLDNIAFHEVYNKAVDTLAATLDSLLAGVDESLAGLCDQLPPASPGPRGHATGYATLVKIMRESFMTQDHVMPSQYLPPSTLGFDGFWIWHEATPDVLVWAPRKAPAVLDLYRYMAMAYGLHLRLDRGVLHVRSHMSLLPAVWTSIALDRQPQVFQAFPNGESTLLDVGYIHGDYVAWPAGDNTIHLRLYSWPTTPGYVVCTRIVVQIPEPHRLLLAMVIELVEDADPPADYLTLNAETRIQRLQPTGAHVLLDLNLAYDREPSSDE
ncbi:hypothetical protein ACHHYP_06240 [Achlya hypogyna]|uniref:Uncharacterized protein n=1 Tax=Achlya hypogyna TaxID=1202772 RepID=A0A1V9YV12_ACHHY|nr:hypothetical protein ACHHYP_06240 [Achlya hypogyna]